MNQRIQLLPPLVAEQIAAGEVIERPASVIKELTENSLDAGATEIEITLERGGIERISVTDNGSGMGRSDLELCLKRHATSKIRALDDLESLHTLGFRGEALPSIASVAEITLHSREQGSNEAYEIRAHAQNLTPEAKKAATTHFLGSSHGTRITVDALFAQIPARLKFLKSQASESSAVRDWIEKLALAHPTIGFQLIQQNKKSLSFRPSSIEERMRIILGDGENSQIVIEESSYEDLHLKVYWLEGLSIPHTRKLIQIVNGRILKDRLLQQASLTPFRQCLLPGQFPALLIQLEIDPKNIDVNMHPTKTEVRFFDSRKVFSLIHSTLERMIQNRKSQWSTPSTLPEFDKANPAAAWSFRSHSSPTPLQTEWMLPPSTFSPALIEPSETATSFTPRDSSLGEYLGIVFNTYLIFEDHNQLVLIDQHAAHERIRYESLKNAVLHPHTGLTSQILLMPEVVTLPSELSADFQSKLKLLSQLGFDCEIFGEDKILFRAIPTLWGKDQLKVRLKNLLHRLLAFSTETSHSSNELVLDEKTFETLASEACHSSIRSGDRIDRIEALHLVARLMACEHPWNCPHGRPTLIKMNESKLEELFLRRVTQ